MLKQVQDQATPDTSKGLNTQNNILAVQQSQSPNMMDVKVNYDGSIEKRLGSNTQNAVIIANSAGAGFSPNSANLLLNNLVSFWKLDETSGSRYDSVGNNTLLDSGNVLYSGGIKNQASIFNASTGQCLYALNPPTLTANNSFSLATWIYLNSTSKTLQRTIISKRDSSSGSNVVFLAHCDGSNGSTSFTDSELTPKTITTNGGVTISTVNKKFGTASGLFPGSSGDNLTVADSSDWDFGTGDFTVDFWINFNSVAGNQYFVDIGNGIGGTGVCVGFENPNLVVYINGSQPVNYSWSPTSSTWYHIAVTRSGSSLKAFIDGNSVASPANSSNITGSTEGLKIGDRNFSTNKPFNGYLDELRVLKGLADYTSNFVPPTSAYNNPVTPREFEYWLYVDTNNQATFDISSSGIVANGSVTASSFGALTTSTWYNIVAWYSSASNQIGISVNLSVNTASYTNGIITQSAPFVIGAISNGTSMFMDGRIDETGYWNKVLSAQERSDLYNSGNGNTYQSGFDTQPWASFDFGASSLRWLTACAGTGIYASSNLGVTWVTIATDRSATYQYLDRSKNVLVATSDAYDTPLFWAGSAGTFCGVLNTSAPLCKYSINFQGFLILLNSNTRKRGFFYNDENTQLTGAWTNNFDIPSSADDEITSAFVLRRYLYVSTRYKLFRVSYVGGNPDWSFVEIKNWGFVPRTVKRIILASSSVNGSVTPSIGEVVMGLTWDRKVRIFDGSGDQIVSNNIEMDNGVCDFSLSKISYLGSGPVISFAETNPNENVYRLCVAIGQDSRFTTHFINYDGRAFSWYPYANRQFNCMCMAESSNQRFMMAFDRSGYCHMLDSGNLDANKTPINDYWESPILFSKSPAQSTKGHRTDLFFSNTSCGTIHYDSRVDFKTSYTDRGTKYISGSDQKALIHFSIDTPETYNGFQFRLSSSSGTKDPWRLIRYDHFAAGLGIGKNE